MHTYIHTHTHTYIRMYVLAIVCTVYLYRFYFYLTSKYTIFYVGKKSVNIKYYAFVG